MFYPDFLIWTNEDVIAVDTTGGHLLPEKAVRKLLRIEAPNSASGRLRVCFVSEGRWNPELEQEDTEGCTIWSLKHDNSRRATYVNDLQEAVVALIQTP